MPEPTASATAFYAVWISLNEPAAIPPNGIPAIALRVRNSTFWSLRPRNDFVSASPPNCPMPSGFRIDSHPFLARGICTDGD